MEVSKPMSKSEQIFDETIDLLKSGFGLVVFTGVGIVIYKVLGWFFSLIS